MANTLRDIQDSIKKRRYGQTSEPYYGPSRESVDAAKGRMNEFAARTNATQTAYGLRNVDPALRAAETRADMGLGSRQDRERRVEREYFQPKMQREAQESELARTRAQFAEPAEITAKSAEKQAMINVGPQYTRAQTDLLGKQTEVLGTLAGEQTKAGALVKGKREEATSAQAIAEAEGIRATRAEQAALERAKVAAEGGVERATISAGGATSRQTEANKVKLGIALGNAQAQAVAANDALRKAQDSGDDAKIEQAAKNAAVASREARNMEEQLNAMGSEQTAAPAGTLRQAQPVGSANMTRDQFIASFTADQKRAPTANEIQRAMGRYWK